MTATTGNEFLLNLDRQSTATNVIELTFLDRQVRNFPHVAEAVMRPSVAPMDLVPAGARTIRTRQRVNGADLVAEASEYAMFVESYAVETHVAVAARSHHEAAELLRQVTQSRIGKESQLTVKVVMWRQKGDRGDRTREMVEAPTWPEITQNYPKDVRRRLQDLVARQSMTEHEGRLILFHGEPGTGKTTAIRALIRAWMPWCDAHLVTDPDRLFSESGYLLDVFHSQEGPFAPALDRPAPEPRWKLIVLEDADSYLIHAARLTAGSALGRLLNATDGLLGQTERVLVLISTNEELVRLHPALVRPGRCLARVEFVRFPRVEAKAWMGNGVATPNGGATLAELFEARRTGVRIKGDDTLTGSYL